MKNWKKFKLSDVCDTQYGFTTSATDEDTGTRFLRITDIAGDRLNWETVPFCEIEDREKAKYLLKEGDIVVARTGATVGFAKQMRHGLPNAVFASYLVRLTVKSGFDKRFIGCLVESTFYKDYINAIAGGAAQPNANAQDLVSLELTLPPLSLQTRIAQILTRYDLLIENCEQQIAALEATAREVFREWFVRGRGPGGAVEEWEEVELGAIANDCREIEKIGNIDDEMPYVGLEHLSIKSIVIKNHGFASEVESDKLKFRSGDILFGKIRAYLHKVCMGHFEGVCSSDTIVLRPKHDFQLGFLMFTVFDDVFIDFADKISNGTKMPRSEWSALKKYKLRLPPQASLEVFNALFLRHFEQIVNLLDQITHLRHTRDTLLPRLLSGQLTVTEAS